MRAFGYLRVSTGEQVDSGAGLGAQRQAIEESCAARGWEMAGFFEDLGLSAKNLKRPGLQEALGRLKAGEADMLVCAKLDRLSRSVMDFAALRESAKREKWQPVALDLPVDPESPMGDAMLNLGVIFAQLERRLISQRTKEALAAKRAEGVILGRPSAVPDELRERIVALAATNGYSGTARLLNAEGVPTVRGGERWWPSTVRQVVT